MTPRRVAAGAVALLFLSGLLVLVRGNGQEPAATRPVATASSTAPAVVPGPTTSEPTAAASASGAPKAGAPPATDVAKPAAAVAPPKEVPQAGVVPGPLKVPSFGRFRYRYAGNASPSDATLTVSGRPGSPRQTHVTVSGDRTEQSLVDWSATARTTLSVGTKPACAWVPALLSLQLPLTVGSAWRGDSACTQGTSNVHLTEDAKVEGATRTTVAGITVDAWIISRHTLTEITAPPAIKAVVEAQSTELFAPSLGLVVYRVTRTAIPQADGSTATVDQTAELLDTRPA